MSPAENMPDFDKMSPEEMMAWMESLAKRQGATEGFTTAADMSIAEVDPDTVIIDEPGYVPSEGKSKGQAVTPEPKKPAAAPPPPPPAPVVSAPPPVLEPLNLDEEALVETEMAQPAEEQGAMAWLESLAADTGGLPELDLSSLGAEIEPILPEPAEAENPIAWLENLAESQGVPTSTPEPAAPTMAAPTAEVGDPFASGVDPMTWLESLAKRQGVKDEELLTQANLDVPVPEGAVDDGPGYTDYSVDAPAKSEVAEGVPQSESQPTGELDPAQLESPADWLDSLASGQGFGLKPSAQAEPDHLSDEAMKKALASGQEINPDQMEAWFNRQLDRGFERDEPELLDEEAELALPLDLEAPAVPAALPDWLSEMAPAAPPPMPTAEQQAFVDKIVEPPAVPDMPDWLQEEVSAHSDLDLDIFAPETPAPAAPASVPASDLDKVVDRSDPWVEAFDHEQGIITLPDVPSTGAPATLEPAALEAEEELPVGQPEPVPDWLSETPAPVLELDETPDWLAEAEAAEPLTANEMPDWLKEVGSEIALAEVPDWLKETADTDEQIVIPPPTPAPVTTTPVTVPSIVPVPASPAPVPAAASMSEADAVTILNSARSQTDSNLEASLLEYERLVRANAQLEAVAGDLTSLVKKNEKNPAIYRVLGDALMRQGQLQAALDTYRSALNLL
jgi:hypothetical protein